MLTIFIIYALIGAIWWFIRVDAFGKMMEKQNPTIPPEALQMALWIMMPVCMILWPMFMGHTLLGLGKDK